MVKVRKIYRKLKSFCKKKVSAKISCWHVKCCFDKHAGSSPPKVLGNLSWKSETNWENQVKLTKKTLSSKVFSGHMIFSFEKPVESFSPKFWKLSAENPKILEDFKISVETMSPDKYTMGIWNTVPTNMPKVFLQGLTFFLKIQKDLKNSKKCEKKNIFLQVFLQKFDMQFFLFFVFCLISKKNPNFPKWIVIFWGKKSRRKTLWKLTILFFY